MVRDQGQVLIVCYLRPQVAGVEGYPSANFVKQLPAVLCQAHELAQSLDGALIPAEDVFLLGVGAIAFQGF